MNKTNSPSSALPYFTLYYLILVLKVLKMLSVNKNACMFSMNMLIRIITWFLEKGIRTPFHHGKPQIELCIFVISRLCSSFLFTCVFYYILVFLLRTWNTWNKTTKLYSSTKLQFSSTTALVKMSAIVLNLYKNSKKTDCRNEL